MYIYIYIDMYLYIYIYTYKAIIYGDLPLGLIYSGTSGDFRLEKTAEIWDIWLLQSSVRTLVLSVV